MPYKNIEDRRRNALKYKAANYEKVRVWGRKAEKKYNATHPPHRGKGPSTTPEYRKAKREANPERQRAYSRKSHQKHRAKRNAESASWRENNPEKVVAYKKSDNGRTVAAAATRRHAAKKNGYVECKEYPQPPTDNKCAICHRDDERLALDHDHDTGKFRGYICRKCNLGLGMLGDTTEAIRRVLQYLEQH